MAKVKTETFWGAIFSAHLFKPNQGRVVRQSSALAVALVFVIAAWRLHVTLLAEAIPWVRLGVPAIVAVVGLWLAFRLVCWQPFANFLISVEAEMDKVSWADWNYLKRATAVVLVTMVVLGAYLFFWDIIWQQIFGFIGFLDLQALES